MENKSTLKLYLFELVERTSRFYLHLNEIYSQFYSVDERSVDDKLIFVQSYKDCLLNILAVCASISADIDSRKISTAILDKQGKVIKSLFESLNVLHKDHLNHLPRPSEPIELKRFSRIIDKHVLKISKGSKASSKKRISIYASEELGDSVYRKDPLEQFKTVELQNIIDDYKSVTLQKTIPTFGSSEDSETIHITIPRIDTNNPCRWPTLLHELGHRIIKDEFFKEGDILSDFIKSLDNDQQKFIEGYLPETNQLHSWLIECWCDLFACVVFGPAFWFSQYVSFISHSGTHDDLKYPRPIFRLKLILNILSHRFPKALFKELKETVSSAESILNFLDAEDPTGFDRNDEPKEVYQYFREYFRGYFSKLGDSGYFGTDILNRKLGPLIKYTQEINESVIRELETSLEAGLPVPNKFIRSDKLLQRPTYVQEILIAAWFFRNNGLKNQILKELKGLRNQSSKFIEAYENGILSIIKKFDVSILRSVQISEWFDLFYDSSHNSEQLELEKLLSKDPVLPSKGQLVDGEIYSLLKAGNLKVIPLMNLKEQLGSTSLDLRLGTSFQLYNQTKYGIVDFSDTKSLRSAEYNSSLIDLDYLESITISPGQFILGHTMEYIKLPDNIAAEIEGRSSFARLGIEVHMTAGFIDPGFEGVVTLEVYNAGPNPVKLFPGVRIAQLKFIEVNAPQKPYNKKHTAKYKGLLTHHTSMQFKDYEIQKILDARNNKQ